MKRKVARPTVTFVWFTLMGLSLGTARADALAQGATIQNQPTASDALDWPRDKVLKPSLKWTESLTPYNGAVEVYGFDPSHLQNWPPSRLLYSAPLSGQRFATTTPADSRGRTLDDYLSNCDTALRGAGYLSEYITIPDKRVAVGHVTSPQRGPGGYSSSSGASESWIDKRYIKLAGPNIRLIIISYLLGLPVRRSTWQAEQDLKVFISDITPLERLLKQTTGLEERKTNTGKH